MSRTPRSAMLFVCDDIRREEGNKYSLMGVYGRDLIVKELPTSLPKLCFQVFLSTAKTNPFKSLVFHVDGIVDKPMNFEVPENVIKAARELEKEPGSDHVRYGVNFTVAPFEARKEQVVKVTVIADGRKMPVGGIRILEGKTKVAAPAPRKKTKGRGRRS